MTEKVPNRKAGGFARRDSLTKEQRSDIAQRAAESRWLRQTHEGPILEATYPGVVKIGEASIPCAVLANGTRVLSDNGITNAMLGSRSGASKRLRQAAKTEGAHLPLFLAPPVLQPFIPEELRAGPLKPILYQSGKRVLVGVDGSIDWLTFPRFDSAACFTLASRVVRLFGVPSGRNMQVRVV